MGMETVELAEAMDSLREQGLQGAELEERMSVMWYLASVWAEAVQRDVDPRVIELLDLLGHAIAEGQHRYRPTQGGGEA